MAKPPQRGTEVPNRGLGRARRAVVDRVAGGLADGHARSGTPPSKSRCSDSRRSAVATRNAMRYGVDLDLAQRRDDEKP
jgi:hypothetical protein